MAACPLCRSASSMLAGVAALPFSTPPASRHAQRRRTSPPRDVRARARVRHPTSAPSPTSRRCSRIWRAPTSCSSASSTTIRTRTASSPRFSRGCVRRNVPVTVSLEMFERDVQPALDAYLGGRNTRGGLSEDQPALAALRDRLPTARRDRQGSNVAGDRRQRAAPLCVGDRQDRDRVAVGAADRRTRADRRQTCSARRTPTSIASPRRWASIRARTPGDRGRIDAAARRSSATTSRSA